MPKFKLKPAVIEAEVCTEVRMIDTLSGEEPEQRARPGDYVVNYPNGVRQVYTPEEFVVLFEPAEPAAVEYAPFNRDYLAHVRQEMHATVKDDDGEGGSFTIHTGKGRQWGDG